VSIADFVSKLKVNKPYYWQVFVKNEEPEERKVIYVWDDKSFNSLVENLRKAHAGVETPAEENFRIGFLLESARFYADAYRYYQKAAQLNPELELYQKTLEAFRKDYAIGQ
jgi:tetratricopeptide (TPR) repeat protein